MNANRIPESKALSAGADLWIIKNDPALSWWSKLDFNSHYLLSQNFLKPEKNTPVALQNILQATSLDKMKKFSLENHILLGSEDHFLNKWILVWNGDDDTLADIICKAAEHLHAGSIRLFSHSQSILGQLEARPTASSLNITYIENT